MIYFLFNHLPISGLIFKTPRAPNTFQTLLKKKKGQNGGNQRFLLFPHSFLSYLTQFMPFELRTISHLRMLIFGYLVKS